MEKIKSALKWNQRSELVKTIFLTVVVIGGTAAGYGLFTFAMGTSSPLVVVTSESMVPTLNVGDLLVLRRIPAEQIHVGDIVVYVDDWYHGAPIVHRITEIQKVDDTYYYFTKGDANTMPDPGNRTYDEIVGVVVFRIPYVGYLSLWLRDFTSTPLGIAIIIGVFGLILFGPELLCSQDSKPEEDESAQPETESVGQKDTE